MAVTIHPEGAPPPAAARQAQPETPSQATIRAANQLRYVTDDRGRQIGWRKLNALEDFDLCEIAGAANASNDEWMMRATVAFGVREIDGEAVSRPANKTQLRALVARLDDAGMSAVLSLFMPDMNAEAEEANSEADRAKNSAGTPISG